MIDTNIIKDVIVDAFGLSYVNIEDYKLAANINALQANNYPPSTSQYNGKFLTPVTADAPDGVGQLGRPIWGSLTITGGSYLDQNSGVTITYPTFRIDVCIMTLTQVNNVVLTQIQGKDGEVVEYIGKNSFRLNVKGGFFSTGNARPKQQVDWFKAAIQSNQPIQVQSTFLQDWDIYEIVVLDRNIPQIAGGYNYQLFEFNAIQNTPVILAQQVNVT